MISKEQRDEWRKDYDFGGIRIVEVPLETACLAFARVLQLLDAIDEAIDIARECRG